MPGQVKEIQTGLRVLVVEDEYFLADDMGRALEKAGAKVVGPVPSRGAALAMIASGAAIDLAILDINLQGETVFPVADALSERNIPFVFATGYDLGSIPTAYENVRRWEKPFDTADLIAALTELSHATRSPPAAEQVPPRV